MRTFAEATAVVPRSGGNEYDAELDARWSVDTKLHGGYLLAVLARAAGRAAPAGHRHPTSVSASFLEPPAPGPAVVTAEVLREGRSSSHVRTRLVQDGRPKIEALIFQAGLAEADPWWSGLEPAELPDRADCYPATTEPPGTGFTVPLMEVVEAHLDPGVLGFAVGEPSRRGLVAGWMRLADGTDWDPLSLLVAVDMVPPASYDLAVPGWAPTISLTAYIRRLPAPGPVKVRQRATDVGGDRMDEVVHVWDSKDRLVAQATQLAAVRVP